MNRLDQELRRLYLRPHAEADAAPAAEALFDAAGHTRALVLELARPADWRVLSAVWSGVQADLALPAPAIAVTGSDGFQLWFSLAQPLPPARAQALLQALQQRYLAAVDPGRVRLLPQAASAAGATPRHAQLVPAEQGGNGLWSAFVAPDLAAVMNDEPWLDLPPNAEGQAALLAGLHSMQAADLDKALRTLQPAPAPEPSPPPAPAASGTAAAMGDPRAFLLSVMNDPAAALALRVEAAKALLAQRT
jgi:hypothetical protein